jgi:hypothetical protein
LAAHAGQLKASHDEPDRFAVDAELLHAVEQWLAVSGGAETDRPSSIVGPLSDLAVAVSNLERRPLKPKRPRH